MILLPEASHTADVIAYADRILTAIRMPHHLGDHELHVTTSIGIATYPDDGRDGQALIDNADSAMYHVKDAGRGSYKFYNPAMTARAIERRAIEDGLRKALNCAEFVLRYQPVVDLNTGAIVGVESLLRWPCPQHGFVPPTQFIGIAEECGLIVPIGRWVLREACRQAQLWREAGLPPLCIAVNVSAVELRFKDFIAGVRTILAETGIDPGRLEFELTETFLMQDSKPTQTVLKSIKQIGIRLALDDFGTGYSSLSYLQRFPIDTLKIDRSFISGREANGDDAGIVRAVISMGESLRMRVVAEGVETREQLDLLRKQGCPFGQGHYFGPPMAAAEFAELLSRQREGLSQQAGQ